MSKGGHHNSLYAKQSILFYSFQSVKLETSVAEFSWLFHNSFLDKEFFGFVEQNQSTLNSSLIGL